jgi:hypothetical protein
MAKTGTQRKSKRTKQSLRGELRCIADEMGEAMMSANIEWVARSETPLTLRMNDVLCKFQDYCMEHYDEKA